MGLENRLVVLSEVATRLQLRNRVVVAVVRYGCDGGVKGWDGRPILNSKIYDTASNWKGND